MGLALASVSLAVRPPGVRAPGTKRAGGIVELSDGLIALSNGWLWLVEAVAEEPPTWTGSAEFVQFVRDFWSFIRNLIIVVAMAIFVSSVDDLFVDISYWALRIWNLLLSPFRRQPKQSRLVRRKEQRIAIMVPAWQEADVIEAMLNYAVGHITYKNYDIFVGVYPNDPATRDAVKKAQANHSNIFLCENVHKGPSTKADCLNGVLSGIFETEKKTGKPYDIFILQDAEDVIHPFSLKVLNYYIPTNDMVQLPVRSLPRRWHQLVASQYMDEFLELHMKDMMVRAAMTNNVPSAGVGTGFSRKAISTLKDNNDGLIFSEDSLTEDYEIGMRLQEYELKGAFVHYRARVRVEGKSGRERWRKEVVAIQEYFPHTFRASVRQKSRWILGISFVGWQTIQWRGSLANRYWLMRDRKVLLTGPTSALGYLIVLNVLITWALVEVMPELRDLPPLIDKGHWIWFFIYANFFFLANRLLHRGLFVGLAHGLRYVWLSPLRAIVANVITFFAWFRAARQFAWSGLTGARLKWEKTVHAFPEQIRSDGRRALVLFSPLLTISREDGIDRVPNLQETE